MNRLWLNDFLRRRCGLPFVTVDIRFETTEWNTKQTSTNPSSSCWWWRRRQRRRKDNRNAMLNARRAQHTCIYYVSRNVATHNARDKKTQLRRTLYIIYSIDQRMYMFKCYIYVATIIHTTTHCFGIQRHRPIEWQYILYIVQSLSLSLYLSGLSVAYIHKVLRFSPHRCYMRACVCVCVCESNVYYISNTKI